MCCMNGKFPPKKRAAVVVCVRHCTVTRTISLHRTVKITLLHVLLFSVSL